ncbi:nuclear mitotic apparatus protein 1 isoform X5 [Hippoglossus hippoglossus]|uniref:nuclear mitotic apparatus protein 1 isoform X5 n=1 Tax=Hippoglossus hippoglossus TaxID=8267 RepID=UPI00148C2680|nr:nuclear mitotic apparatus protein 1 isoform X5 [Hippoglossus hippoglossus]
MTINLGVKALLSWVNSIKLSDREIAVDDLQDGTLFLKVIYMLKKQSNPCFSHSTEDRFNLIADFVESDCRFSAAKGSSLSLGNIRDDINLTVEIAKVLLLLVYYDMMNDRCTLNMLECDVEREIANLTGSFVMESEDCVYLSNRIDAYLAKRHLPVSREIFERSATTSTSNVSTMSSLSDEDSPVFHRTKKITFVDMHTVASSSASKSPLQDIMNTPKFQMRVMQRQMMKERDYRDGLERELSGKLSLISQKESHVNQLQYRLDKLKEEQGDQEDVTREQINDLETKNNTLQMRLNEIFKKNKDLKSTSSLMERKVDNLTDENGVLSSQVRTVCSQLAIFEAEVGRLTESQASSQEEWQSQTTHLQTELNQATAEKELLTEQIQILQGKISCLEDEISKATQEEVGENMGPVMEREMVETEINDLKNELDSTFSSLKQAEMEIQTKSHQLADYQQEITQQKELLQQQKSQTGEMIQAKDELLDKLQKEITEQRAALHQEIQHLKLQLDQVEQQKTEQTTRLQQHVAACEREIERLKEMKREREDLLHQTEEKVKDLEAKLSAASSLLADKDQQIISLKDKVDVLTGEAKIIKEEIQAKEEMLAKILLEKSNEQEILHDKIQTLTTQVEDLNSSLKQAEQEIQHKQDLLAKTHQENIEQREMLQQQVATCEEEVQKVNAEIQVRNQQLVTLRNDSSCQSGLLEEEIQGLKSQVENLNDSLTKSAQQVQAQLVLLNKQEHESSHQKELLQQQLSASDDQVRSMREEIQAKEEQMNMLRTDGSEQSDSLNQEIQSLKEQVESLSFSLSKVVEDVQSKEDLLAQREDEIQKLKACRSEMESLLLRTEQRIEILQTELSAVNALVADKDQHLTSLREEVAVQAIQLQKAREEAEANERILAEIRMESSKQTDVLQREIQALKGEVKDISLELSAKEQMLLKTQQESSQQIDLLQQQLVSVNTELNQHKDTHAANLRLREGVEELQVATLREKEALVQERQELLARIHQAEIDQKALEKQLKAMAFEKERLAQSKQATEKENATSRKLESVLQQELEMLKMEKEKLLKESEKAEDIEVLKRGLQEQLSAKSEAVEHYKAQMEKAVNHYNGKKQLLQECQQEVTELKHSLGVKECEVKTITMENKLLQRDLGKTQTNEKNLLDTVASLKAQLTFADHNLQMHNKVHGKKGSATELSYLDIHNTHSSLQTMVKRTVSSDSLDQSSLEDSLNNTRKLSGPDESSTPLVRSSDRLAAKRRGLQSESLETLYFTPISTRQINRTSTENRMELDSTRKNPSSSVKRRRTTQVINITLTKKTPGGGEGDETFYSLASARSHPNLSRAHPAKPVSMELFGTPARMTAATSDQLISLPGYRRSTIHSQTTSTFCVGSENEPEGAPDDWLRIAELQSRNRACLPHLKSSYPVESEAGQGSVFIFTDEEVRTGDPSDTIRRASTMPGQLQDSLVSHRHSLMMGQSGAAANTRSHRLSLMPGQLPSKSVSSSQIRSPKGTKRSSSTLSVHQISPEKRVKASCFPRPLTPKNKNVNSGSSSSHLRPVLSPAERRQSMMFTVDNTPKKDNYLKKGLKKLRTSTNNPSGDSNSGVGRASRTVNFKSPQVTIKGRRKSPQTTSKIGKSPGLTASARKKPVSVNEENFAGGRRR